MYRLVKLGTTWYAVSIDSIEDDIENMESLLCEDDAPILIVNDLAKAAEVLDIDEEDIIKAH